MKQETYKTAELFNYGGKNSSVMGGFLIFMGVIFFLGMSGVTVFGHSAWMLVALLPVYWIVVTAYRRYQLEGRSSRAVFSILLFGLLPFAYIAAFILGINVSTIWPIGLIVTGAGYILFGMGK